MGRYQIDFDAPGYLFLLVLVPVVWWFSFRSLSGLGRFRRLAALTLRTMVLLLFILALAEIQLVRTSDRLTVIYLLDQSLSIPTPERQAMIEYVNRAIRQQRHGQDRAGVIVFGRDPAIEIPPFDDDVRIPGEIESPIDPDYTNLAAAMRLAEASFPEDAAKRIVVVSDGNENIGSAIEQARSLIDAGIGIDVRPIHYHARADIALEKLAVPTSIRKGEPFDLRIVVNNTAQPTAEDAGNVSGRLVVYEKTSEQPAVISEQRLTIGPGRHVYTIRRQIDQPDFYTYEAQFIPDDPADDALRQNNRATTFAHIRGSGQVLLIEDHEHRGEHDLLVERLRDANLEVAVRGSDQLFTHLGELQAYDTVLLANVPREDFSDAQIRMLVQNTQQMGCGLVMLGGPNSFGAGGWINTELEKAMPVDFEIKAAKVMPRGALAMIMHASEIANGNHWQKVIAQEALKALGSQDYCGVLHWNGTDQWLWNPGLRAIGDDREKMLARIAQMTPSDMPEFGPSMEMARRAFAQLADAAVKHMIIISDGDPARPSNQILNGLVAGKVTVSTVAVGAHGPAESQLLQQIASYTGGKYYQATSPNALPRIFQREARRVARPLIYEHLPGFRPQVRISNEILSGIEDELPPITGYVLTTVKQHPLVEVEIVSPRPPGGEHNTILATWTYGLGRTVAFTTDAGARWATNWTGWDGYEKLFSQMVRWSMRPAGDTGNFTVATEVKEGEGQVVVTALDKEDKFLNFLPLSGTIIGPDMVARELTLKQVAPGRYAATFDGQQAGNYFLMISPGAGQAPLRTGINVPYSPEFQTHETNEALLASLSALFPRGGKPGLVILDDARTGDVEQLLRFNTFRHDLPRARSNQDAWHDLLLIGGCLFFFDVLVRRVSLSLMWVGPLVARVRNRITGREAVAPAEQMLERLSTRKAEIAEQLESRRAAARFEPEASDLAAGGVAQELGEEAIPTQRAAPAAQSLAPGQEAEEESYTARLLRAKRRVWDERERPPGAAENPPPDHT
jgi:uncharacterized membrane protein/Mg-chelatase subunit ChlD